MADSLGMLKVSDKSSRLPASTGLGTQDDHGKEDYKEELGPSPRIGGGRKTMSGGRPGGCDVRKLREKRMAEFMQARLQ